MIRAVAAALLGVTLSFSAAAAPRPGEITRVEAGLLPPVSIAGEPLKRMNLTERMTALNVPAVSIAVIQGQRLHWARAYGVRRVGGEPVNPRTLFQAASIAKPVTAAALLTLVKRGRLSLDRPVNDYLSSWRLPDSDLAPSTSVTLRGLLSHSAGLSVDGFKGYEPGDPVPTVRQILGGLPPANSEPVRIKQKPGSWHYSGGGYTIAQQLLEDISKRPFALAVQKTVLAPAGMRDSSFAQPLPDSLAGRAAVGHNSKGEALNGGWDIHPELAAAGLWSTPTDLARFALWVMKGLNGPGAPPAQSFAARHLVQPQVDTPERERMGLGLFVRDGGQKLQVRHSGSNDGYKALMVAFPGTGQGAVIMTNGDGGAALIAEIMRSIAAEYSWPTSFHEMVVPARLESRQLKALAGTYRMAGGPGAMLAVEAGEGKLYARVGKGPAMELIPVDSRNFVAKLTGARFRFDNDSVTIIPTNGTPRTARREHPAK